MNSAKLAVESTYAWWVSGGSNAGLSEGLTFAKGQYAVPSGSHNTIPLDDSPQAADFWGNIRFYISCTDYLMFQPNGGIWVPLGKTKTPWSVNCHASSASLDILPDNHVTGPGDIDNSTDFPKWTDVFSNH
jgi:hypothetical protein